MLFILDIIYKLLFYFEPVVILLWLLLVLYTYNWYKIEYNKNEDNKFSGISLIENNDYHPDTKDLSYIIRYNAIVGGVLYFISLFFRIHPLLISIGSYIKIVGMILIVGTMICIPIHASNTTDNNLILGYSYYIAIVPVLIMIIKCIYIL